MIGVAEGRRIVALEEWCIPPFDTVPHHLRITSESIGFAST